MKGERPLFSNAEMVSEESRKKWRDRIAFIRQHSQGLTEWESEFVTSMRKLMENGHDLTLAQSSKLNQIFHKREEAIG